MPTSILKRIYNFINLLYATLVSIARIILRSRLSPLVKKLKAKDQAICYVLGNGPSLKDALHANLELIKSQELFVVNDFVRSKYYAILKPKYYVLLDPGYWDSDSESLNDCNLVLNLIREKTTWDMYIIVPNQAHKIRTFREIFLSNTNISIMDFNSTTISGFKWFNLLSYKNYLGTPPLNNVVGACIFVAINMKYKEINLLGVDHSWTQNIVVSEKNQVCCTDPHFYDEVNCNLIPHKTVYGEYYTMHRLLRDYATMFEGYHYLRIYAEIMKVRIVNRYKKSFIDAFEKKDLIDDIKNYHS